MNFKVLALILYTLSFLYSMFLQYVRRRSRDNPIPENVKDLYDAETYSKWQSYRRETGAASLISYLVTFPLYFLLIAFDFFPHIVFSSDPILAALTVIAFTVTLDTLTSAIFEYIFTMKIDEKYGFNRSTLKIFISDQIKKWIIYTVIYCAFVALFIKIHQAAGDWILLIFSGIMVLVVFGIMFLAPFISIFNKFTPLEEGELRDKLTALLEKNGYHVRKIQVMNASKRTTRANAYFTGIGKSKTIVLYDTLLNVMTPDEITAVFAHELGHGLHKDTLKNSVLGILQMVLLVVLTWLTVRTEAIYPQFGFDGLNYGFGLFLVMIIEMPIILPVFSLLRGYTSRKAEYRADAQAVKEGYGKDLVSALKKLSKDNLADLAPSKIEVALTYSHPPLSARIEAIQKRVDG